MTDNYNNKAADKRTHQTGSLPATGKHRTDRSNDNGRTPARTVKSQRSGSHVQNQSRHGRQQAAEAQRKSRRQAPLLRVVFATMPAGDGPRAAPYGAARVAAAIKADWSKNPGTRCEIEVRIFEAPPGTTVAGIAAGLNGMLAGSPIADIGTILGLSLYSWNSGSLIEAARAIKDTMPGCIIVAGGPDTASLGMTPSGIAEATAAPAPFDAVIIGEGEESMTSLVRDVADGTFAPGRIIRAGPIPVAQLATLPSPWLDGTLDPGRYGGAAVELARGCPFRCAFCYESKGLATQRRFPASLLARELEAFAQSGVEEVFVLDPTFNIDERHMAEAVGIFSRSGDGLRYYLELRGELITARQAELLSRLDCTVQIGLQSADPAVMKLVDRPFDPARFAARLRLLDEEGITWGLDLIYGLPGDTLSGLKKSLGYALSLGPNHLDVFRLAVLPGTALYDRRRQLGMVSDAEAPYLVRSTPSFSAEDLAAAGRLAEAVDIFYNNGRAVMWYRTVAAWLRTSTAGLIEQFAFWLETAHKSPGGATVPRDHEGIESLQTAFIQSLVTGASAPDTGNGQGRLQGASPLAGNKGSAGRRNDNADRLAAALDLIRVSGAWTRALAEGTPTRLNIGWDPEALLDDASAGIEDFCDGNPPHAAVWVCQPGPDGPRFRRERQGKPAS